MNFNANEIEAILKYTFNDKNLLRCAFTHRSFTHEFHGFNNERLEFLGDSILGFIVADYIFKTGRKDEGRMTREKQNLVSKEPLGRAIERIGLQRYIIFGESLEGESPSVSSCENLFEALVAAIYLDGGLDNARKFVERFLLKDAKKVMSKNEYKDYKSQLQERLQAKKMDPPQYVLISKTGLDHDPLFTMGVVIDGKTVAVGQGKSKSDASKDAAKRALKKITGRNN